MITPKIKAVAESVSKLAEDSAEQVKDELNSRITSKVYSRASHLPKVMGIEFSRETDEPNVINPQMGDVVNTLHILSRLQAAIREEDIKNDSGAFPFNFIRRIGLVHALIHELAILKDQMRVVERNSATSEQFKELEEIG